MSIALMLSVTLSQAQGVEVPALKPSHLKALMLVHEDRSFKVVADGKIEEVPACWVDKDVRSVSTERLSKMLGHGYLSVNQMSNGEFSVKANVRGEGGGVGGAAAGAWFGKALVSVVCHGSIAAVSTVIGIVATPAAGVAFGIAAESTLGASIEAASLAGAVGFGILGGVASGPA